MHPNMVVGSDTLPYRHRLGIVSWRMSFLNVVVAAASTIRTNSVMPLHLLFEHSWNGPHSHLPWHHHYDSINARTTVVSTQIEFDMQYHIEDEVVFVVRAAHCYYCDMSRWWGMSSVVHAVVSGVLVAHCFGADIDCRVSMLTYISQSKRFLQCQKSQSHL